MVHLSAPYETGALSLLCCLPSRLTFDAGAIQLAPISCPGQGDQIGKDSGHGRHGWKRLRLCPPVPCGTGGVSQTTPGARTARVATEVPPGRLDRLSTLPPSPQPPASDPGSLQSFVTLSTPLTSARNRLQPNHPPLHPTHLASTRARTSQTVIMLALTENLLFEVHTVRVDECSVQCCCSACLTVPPPAHICRTDMIIIIPSQRTSLAAKGLPVAACSSEGTRIKH